MCLIEEFRGKKKEKFLRRRIGWKIFDKRGTKYNFPYGMNNERPEMGKEFTAQPFLALFTREKPFHKRLRKQAGKTGFFHCFASREDAEKVKEEELVGQVVVKVRMKNTLSAGVSNTSHLSRTESMPCITCTKITLLEEAT